MSYPIDRKMAATWSKERIIEELVDLRRQEAACVQEERNFAQYESDRFLHPLTDPITEEGERQLQQEGQKLARCTAAVRSDIEYLKSLLQIENNRATQQSQLPPLEAEVQELKERARRNQELQLYLEALEDLLRAEAKNPYDHRLEMWIGDLYLRHLQDPTNGLAHYEKAIRYAAPRSAQDTAKAWLGASHCKEAFGDLNGAYLASKQAVTLDSATPGCAYEHAAHSALVQKPDEALAALEQAIEGAADYWVAAKEDKRFQHLGDPLLQLLDKMHATARDRLEKAAQRSAELRQLVSSWEIQSFDADKYKQLLVPLVTAESKLMSGGYPEYIASFESAQRGLAELIPWLDKQVAGVIRSTEKQIEQEKVNAGRAREEAREAGNRGLGAGLGVVGLLAVLVGVIALLSWSCSLGRIEDLGDLFLAFLKLGLIGIVIAGGYYVLRGIVKTIQSASHHSSERAKALAWLTKTEEDRPMAEHRLRVLRAQHDSLKPFLL